MEKDLKNCTCDQNSDSNQNAEVTCDETCECKKDECICNDKCECKTEDVKHSDDSKKHDSKEKHKSKKEEKELKEKLDSALKEINDLNDKLLREKAEVINYRRRKDDEVSKMLKYANEDLILEMLPIIDNFESAIKMDDDNLEDEVSKFLQGFKMVYGNLITVLEKFDIKPIDGVNKPFDPAYHQAVMTEKSDKESGTVVDVLRKGYILKDKVIRPAMVKVSE